MTKKITNEERDLLLVKRMEKLDKSKAYQRDLFKTYYKEEELKGNMQAWAKYNYKQKLKIVKQIQKWEDKAILQGAYQIHKFNVPQALDYVRKFKHKQLVSFGVREK